MTIFTRSALEFHGHNPAPDVASVIVERGIRRIVTWAEVMDARRKWQCELLNRKRFTLEWRAYKLWVGYFDQALMGGWQAHLEDFRGAGYREWIDRDRSWLKPMLMKAFPLVLDLGTEQYQWGLWKVAFAKRFERRKHDRRPLGVAYLWWNGRDCPRAANGPGGEA